MLKLIPLWTTALLFVAWPAFGAEPVRHVAIYVEPFYRSAATA